MNWACGKAKDFRGSAEAGGRECLLITETGVFPRLLSGNQCGGQTVCVAGSQSCGGRNPST